MWLIHIHIDVPLHQAVTKTPIRSIIFPTFRVISDKFSTQVWQSGHLWDTVLYFNGCISNPCWITRICLKNTIREFPITFILVQLLVQKYVISEIQCLDWCHHFWTWILSFLYWPEISSSAKDFHMDLSLKINYLYSPG